MDYFPLKNDLFQTQMDHFQSKIGPFTIKLLQLKMDHLPSKMDQSMSVTILSFLNSFLQSRVFVSTIFMVPLNSHFYSLLRIFFENCYFSDYLSRMSFEFFRWILIFAYLALMLISKMIVSKSKNRFRSAAVRSRSRLRK